MTALYLLQFSCLIFMLINAALLAMSRLHARWENKRYEASRWLIFLAFILLAGQYLMQIQGELRASGDDLGAIANMLVYTPSFALISMGIYNIEATHTRRRHMLIVSIILYAAILLFGGIGYFQTGSVHIGGWLYGMLLFYGASVVYDVVMISSEMKKRKKMLETMAANDMLPYVRYSRVSLILLFLAALVMPVAILSTTLLIIVGPVVLCAILFFTLTFISLGNNYVPTEALLDEETEQEEESGKEENTQNGGQAILPSPMREEPSSKRNCKHGAMAMVSRTLPSICSPSPIASASPRQSFRYITPSVWAPPLESGLPISALRQPRR